MKIAFVCPDDVSLVLFCKGILYTLKSIEGGEVSVLSDFSEHAKYKNEIQCLGVNILSVPMYRFFSPLDDCKYFIALYRIFRMEKFDVVINFSTKPNIYGTIAAKLAGVGKVFFHVVGMGASFLPADGLRAKIIRFITLRLYRLACVWCDKVWFTNKNDLDYFILNGMIDRQKTVLSKNYLDTDAYSIRSVSQEALDALKIEFNISHGDIVVVMVARMIWHKGIKEFAEAAELLSRSHSHVKFLLVAPLEDGSDYAVSESYIREKEKTSNLKWLGFRSDVKPIYALSDIAVLPSYYKEGGFPRALLEPMSMGKPVIAANTPDCRGPVEEGMNGFLVPPQDSKALARAIELLAKDGNLRSQFGQYSCLKARQEFDERTILPQVLKTLGLIVPFK